MPYRLPSLNALRVFEAAARHLSFKLAAAELAVTPTAVSHQIRDLENYLGQVLFRRLARKLELTAAGAALLPKVAEGMGCFVAAVESLRGLTTRAGLMVKAPPTFASRWLVPRLATFTDGHQDVTLHLVSSLDTIDDARQVPIPFTVIGTTEDGGAELEIRFGIAESRPGYRAEPFLAAQYLVVCAPKLLQGKGALKKPEDVRHHTLIHDDTIPDERHRPSWKDWCAKAGINVKLSAKGTHFHDSGLVLAAVADGMGIALLSRQLVAPDVAAGRVAIPFDIDIPSDYGYYLVIPEGVAQRREVQAFRDWIVAEGQRDPPP